MPTHKSDEVIALREKVLQIEKKQAQIEEDAKKKQIAKKVKDKKKESKWRSTFEQMHKVQNKLLKKVMRMSKYEGSGQHSGKDQLCFPFQST